MTKKMQWSTDTELNAALELDAKKLADMGVEGYEARDEEPEDGPPVCARCGNDYYMEINEEPTTYCDGCAHERVDELEKREPLVQEVIELSKRLATGDLKETGYFLAAVHKLAEWKP